MGNFWSDILQQLQHYYTDIIVLLPKLVLATVVFTILYFLSNRSRNFLSKRLTEKMDDPLLAKFIASLVKIFIVVVALMIVLDIIGLSQIAAGLITGAGVSAIVVGFAFKDIGENLLAGIMLAFNRPFRIGDIVKLDGYEGTVISLNLRNTQIKTFDGKDIYIPNASIVKNPVINYTIDGFLRFDFTLGLEYGSNVNKAIEITEGVLLSIPGILQGDKAPAIHVTDLNPSRLNLTSYYWLNTFDKTVSGLAVKTQAIDQVSNALRNAGYYLPGEVVEVRRMNEGMGE